MDNITKEAILIMEALPAWANDTFKEDDTKAKASPAAKVEDDYQLGGKTDSEKGMKRKVASTVSELLKTKGAVTKVAATPKPAAPAPSVGKLKDAPDWLVPKPANASVQHKDIKGVPPVLARQLANWHRLTGSEKTKLEREFKVRGLSQPHLYLEDSYYGTYNVSIEKRGMIWNYMIESEDGVIASGTSATEKNAIATVNKKLQEVDEQAKHEVECVSEAVDYIKQFASLKSL